MSRTSLQLQYLSNIRQAVEAEEVIQIYTCMHVTNRPQCVYWSAVLQNNISLVLKQYLLLKPRNPMESMTDLPVIKGQLSVKLLMISS